MTRDELLAKLASLRLAPIEKKRAPHKPLLLLWLLYKRVTDYVVEETNRADRLKAAGEGSRGAIVGFAHGHRSSHKYTSDTCTYD